MFTDQEIKCIDLTTELWNEYLKLPIEHPMDQQEFCFHIHALQNIILSRPGLRELNLKNEQPNT